MKGMYLEKPATVSEQPLRFNENLTKPTPAPHQVLLKTRVCGVCHTDLHTVEGDLTLPKQPIIPGHQVVATVEEVGNQVMRHSVGDRVGVAWLNWACGQCEYCQNGQENLCPDAQFTGLHADGGYAQYLVVDENYAYPLPDVFSDAEASPLLCAGIIGYRSLRLSGIQPGQRLGLYGFGASAHLAIQVARHWECEVYVFTRGEAHRRLAEELGAVWTGNAQDQPPQQLHAGVTFAPVGWIIPYALGHLRPGGTVAINAIHLSPIPQMEYPLLYEERTLRSVANFTRRDAEEFLQLAAKIPIRTEVESFPLEQANEVLQKLKQSEIRGAAALEMPQ